MLFRSLKTLIFDSRPDGSSFLRSLSRWMLASMLTAKKSQIGPKWGQRGFQTTIEKSMLFRKIPPSPRGKTKTSLGNFSKPISVQQNPQDSPNSDPNQPKIAPESVNYSESLFGSLRDSRKSPKMVPKFLQPSQIGSKF